MTTTCEAVTYRRNSAVLWRDAGAHVVVMTRGESASGEIVLLGGGSAVLWRLLDQPRRVEYLTEQLAAAGAGPSADELLSTLAELHLRALVVADSAGAK